MYGLWWFIPLAFKQKSMRPEPSVYSDQVWAGEDQPRIKNSDRLMKPSCGCGTTTYESIFGHTHKYKHRSPLRWSLILAGPPLWDYGWGL